MADYILPSPRKVNAVYDYSGENPHELKFHEGDTIEVLNTFNATGWWYGSRDGKFGIFPSNYTVPAAEQRRMKRRENTSMFIKKMQVDLGFVKKDTHALPDGAEESSAYQAMIIEMKDHITQLEKSIDDLKTTNSKQSTIIEELTKKIEQETLRDMPSEVLQRADAPSSPSIQESGNVEHLRSEIDRLTIKFAEALRRLEEATVIIEEQNQQIVDNNERKMEQDALEEKLTSQLDDALKKEEEAYNALSELRKQVSDMEEYKSQSELMEKMSAQLDDALRKEEEADNFVIEQQKLLDDAKQQHAERVDSLFVQLEEAQSNEKHLNTLVAELRVKLVEYEETNRALSSKATTTTELQKRHAHSSEADVAIEKKMSVSPPAATTKFHRRHSSMAIYFLVGLAIGVMGTFSYRC